MDKPLCHANDDPIWLIGPIEADGFCAIQALYSY